jgi:regulator of nucleoside diphosphate kinase
MFPVSSPAVADRLLSELDHQRLQRLALQHVTLQDLLDVAELRPSAQLPADIVSMNSEVEVVDPARGQRQRLTLCYPAEARPELGRISVLSPVGLSLLGRAVGAEVSWPSPVGSSDARLRIQALLYQPESSGDLSR